MKFFTLIGRPTLLFKVQREFMAADAVPAVHGITLDAKLQTTARVADVVDRSDTTVGQMCRIMTGAER